MLFQPSRSRIHCSLREASSKDSITIECAMIAGLLPSAAAEPIGGRTQVARVVNLANWSDANTSDLAAHEPEPTDAIVELETKH